MFLFIPMQLILVLFTSSVAFVLVSLKSRCLKPRFSIGFNFHSLILTVMQKYDIAIASTCSRYLIGVTVQILRISSNIVTDVRIIEESIIPWCNNCSWSCGTPNYWKGLAWSKAYIPVITGIGSDWEMQRPFYYNKKRSDYWVLIVTQRDRKTEYHLHSSIWPSRNWVSAVETSCRVWYTLRTRRGSQEYAQEQIIDDRY